MTHTPDEHETGAVVGGFGDGSVSARVDGSVLFAEIPSEVLVILAGKLGNPLALLVSKAHLSKSCHAAARDALAVIERADLSKWSRTVDDAAVKKVVSKCPKLSSLNLSGCEQITEVAVAAVSSKCPKISSLDLGRCIKITDAALVAVASGCPLPQLTSLDLSGCEQITDEAVVAVASGCPKLSSLSLHGCKNLTDVAVVAVAVGCGKQLTSLNLWLVDDPDSGCDITDVGVKALAWCKQLKWLDLSNCTEITVAALVAVASGCPQLTSLYLRECHQFGDDAILAVASGCKELNVLELGCYGEGNGNLTNKAVVALASKCPNLESIGLNSCYRIGDAAVVALASGCPQLTSLDLHYNSNITDEALAALSSCKKLRYLDVEGCDNITDAAVMALVSACKELVWLDLPNDEDSHITGATITNIRNILEARWAPTKPHELLAKARWA